MDGGRGVNLPFTANAGELLEADAAALFRAAAGDRLQGVPVGRVARRFHRGLAEGLADWARAGQSDRRDWRWRWAAAC